MKSSNAGNEIETKHKQNDHETLVKAAFATNEESNYEEKEQDAPEEVMLTRDFPLQEVSKILHDVDKG